MTRDRQGQLTPKLSAFHLCPRQGGRESDREERQSLKNVGSSQLRCWWQPHWQEQPPISTPTDPHFS